MTRMNDNTFRLSTLESVLFISLAALFVLAVFVISRRRLSDMASTAQQHTGLRLTGLSVRIDEIRDQLEQMQRILEEVE